MSQSQASSEATDTTSDGRCPRRVLIFGEVLFDHLPDASRFGPAVDSVTRGAQGAYAVDCDGSAFAPAVEPKPFRDSVDAGDAFSPATIGGLVGGLVGGLPPHQFLNAAVKPASLIGSITGATSSDESLYQEVVG